MGGDEERRRRERKVERRLRGRKLTSLHSWLQSNAGLSFIRVVATTPRKDPQPNISDLRDHSQSIFRPILTRIPKKKKKKKSCHPYILTS